MKANAFMFLFPFSNGKNWVMQMHVLLRWHTIGLVAANISRRLMQMRCCCVSANALLLTFPRMHGVADEAVVTLLTETIILWPMPS